MRIAFVHPDLGIGGAERLIVDAAVSLQDLGHQVVIYTAHHEPARSFEETRSKLEVRVRGDFFPRHACGRGHVFFASVRNAYTATCLALSEWRPELIIADQVSTCIPILRLFTRAPVVFYVHFPDKLLAARHSWLRRLYRLPFDLMEEATTGCAHRLLVNSQFTASVFRTEFPRLVAARPVLGAPAVLYPSVAVHSGDIDAAEAPAAYVVSLNRYERKKRVDLAVNALAFVPELRLIVAGGYDDRLAENVEYLEELRQLSAQLGLEDRITFERSVSDDRRRALISSALCLLYTPPNEHFGIVPLEAMALGCPVVATNSGGPLESVKHLTTGFLVEPTPRAFADAINSLRDEPSTAAVMRRAARAHVKATFSRGVFAEKLERICRDVVLETAAGQNRHPKTI